MKTLTNITYAYGDSNFVKQAALFYDHVFPWLCFNYPMVTVVSIRDWDIIKDDFNALIEHGMIPQKLQTSLANLEDPELEKKLFQMGMLHVSKTEDLAPFPDDYFGVSAERAADKIRSHGFKPNFLLSTPTLISPNAVIDDISIMLNGVELIDTTKASWEQVLEYRNDENAKKKLRNLRLFLHTNYEGKNLSYIEDDFGKRIDDYKSTAKKHGFETTISTMTLITNSKNLVRFGTASMLAALMGQPVVAAALTPGIFIELLKIGLEITSKRHAFNEFKRNSDIAYVMDFYKYIEKSRR